MTTPNKYHPSGYAYAGALQPAESVERMFYPGYGPDVVWRHVFGVLKPFIQHPNFTLTPIDPVVPFCVGRNHIKRQRKAYARELARRLRNGRV